ncbi:MAG: response regulator transcription factor [Ignavibacteriales bacterium]|nr:response regulator transcription factor [Ignavibacteriales bacterium]
MSKKINVLIVDDEKLARDIVKKYLEQNVNINLLGECINGYEGIKSINEMKPDLIFLDIQMPKINGFEMLELLDHKPEIIFTTAFDQYAIKAFEVNATDYLLKPFSLDRFNEALSKAIEKVNLTEKGNSNYDKILSTINESKEYLDRIVVKTNNKIVIIPVGKIIYLEAQDDYVMINSELGKHLKKQTMKYYEEHLDDNEFIRIHRSYIVNINEVKQVELFEKESYKVKLKNGETLPVSRSGYNKIKEILK